MFAWCSEKSAKPCPCFLQVERDFLVCLRIDVLVCTQQRKKAETRKNQQEELKEGKKGRSEKKEEKEQFEEATTKPSRSDLRSKGFIDGDSTYEENQQVGAKRLESSRGRHMRVRCRVRGQVSRGRA